MFRVKNVGWNEDEGRFDIHEQVVENHEPEHYIGGWMIALSQLQREPLSIVRTEHTDGNVAYTAEAVTAEGERFFLSALILSDLPYLSGI